MWGQTIVARAGLMWTGVQVCWGRVSALGPCGERYRRYRRLPLSRILHQAPPRGHMLAHGCKLLCVVGLVGAAHSASSAYGSLSLRRHGRAPAEGHEGPQWKF